LNETQIAQFTAYADFLLAKNQVMNLTAIDTLEGVWRKHFLDSLSLSNLPGMDAARLLDVGSGAGFPSLPLKILFPKLQVTIVDALQKRIDFLRELTEQLGLNGVTLIHGRAEELNQREAFDYVTARAVARLNVLMELCLPWAKVGGAFVAMKGSDFEAERRESLTAVKTLGGTFETPVVYSLGEAETHALVIVRKQVATPIKYPRSFAKIKTKPL
jgi:16S rRNA (guanine527-N7)-methyltransferase